MSEQQPTRLVTASFLLTAGGLFFALIGLGLRLAATVPPRTVPFIVLLANGSALAAIVLPLAGLVVALEARREYKNWRLAAIVFALLVGAVGAAPYLPAMIDGFIEGWSR